VTHGGFFIFNTGFNSTCTKSAFKIISRGLIIIYKADYEAS